jgi:hypothetical protein
MASRPGRPSMGVEHSHLRPSSHFTINYRHSFRPAPSLMLSKTGPSPGTRRAKLRAFQPWEKIVRGLLPRADPCDQELRGRTRECALLCISFNLLICPAISTFRQGYRLMAMCSRCKSFDIDIPINYINQVNHCAVCLRATAANGSTRSRCETPQQQRSRKTMRQQRAEKDAQIRALSPQSFREVDCGFLYCQSVPKTFPVRVFNAQGGKRKSGRRKFCHDLCQTAEVNRKRREYST